MPNEVTGMNRETGKLMTGWPYVRQSIANILTTAYFERVMRPYVGSNARRLIGELANVRTAQRFRWAVALALELWVPNFRPLRIDQVDLSRDGDTGWFIEGTYYPRGHLGDYSHGTRYTLDLVADSRGGVSVQ